MNSTRSATVFALAVFCSVVVLGLVSGYAPAPAWAQANYRPLERGEYVEEEERLKVFQGMEVSGAYAGRMMEESSGDLPGEAAETKFHQDFRLHLRTVFNRNISMHLVLETFPTDLTGADIRDRAGEAERERIADGQTLNVRAREAFLRYHYNPRSAFTFGTHEVSLGDRRGKTFEAIVPGATFDCEVGTWCMPFGAVKVGPDSADWVYHLALNYTAWDEPRERYRSALEVEAFRIIYTERNVPVGRNLGPTGDDPEGFAFNPSPASGDPRCTGALDGQLVDETGCGLYYDARNWNYFGLRVNWELEQFYVYLDATSSQGLRRYHLPREGGTVIGAPEFNGQVQPRRTEEHINGVATEMEIGYRGAFTKLGLRFMNATGDDYEDPGTADSYRRTLEGYYEITPGAYRGSRLYFNGTDARVDSGAGLGHSVNNTRLVGLFFDYDNPAARRLGYSLGLYQLLLNRPIPDQDGVPQDRIGIEWDNMFRWYWNEQLQLQLEANLLQPQGAFRFNDHTLPDPDQELFVQTLARLVYRF